MRAKAMEAVKESFRVLDAVDLLSSAGVIFAPRVPHITRKNRPGAQGSSTPVHTSSYAEAAAPVSIFTARIYLLWLGWPRQQDVLYVWEAPRHRRHITIFT